MRGSQAKCIIESDERVLPPLLNQGRKEQSRDVAQLRSALLYAEIKKQKSGMAT